MEQNVGYVYKWIIHLVSFYVHSYNPASSFHICFIRINDNNQPDDIFFSPFLCPLVEVLV